jgi:CheY-like chemotaxis protein
MSHEIRTPLNGVMGIASALARTELTPAQTEMVSLIETSAKTLEALLSDILDLARIESGKMEIKAEPFDLGHSVKACGALFAASAEAKGLDYRVEVDPGAAGGYLGDAPRIRQIISNLLGNAVKFTTSGGVLLKVSAVRGETASQLRFDVSDTGIGFDAEAKAKLFSRFQQADGSITRKFGGTGLGLAISRSLAEAMGGGLSADSAPGRGSTFTLVLELPRSIGETEIWDGVEEVEPQAPELRGFSVLVAEDHPTNRKVVELILGSLDLELTCVEDGAQAVAAVEQQAFDLILMDMQMPVMDGLTAIRIIREMEAREVRPRTPIYSLTANALREHIDASKAAGADGHIAKPITADALIAKVMAVANGDLDTDDAAPQVAVG